jgi:monoterpene epsilon-lactone hydrolase
MHGFPPTFLTTGTRDLLLSSTVRVHQKMRRADVEAILYVHEGMPHGAWNRDISAPETKERDTARISCCVAQTRLS